MAFYLINIIRSENDYVTGIPVVYGHFECDTASDLPAQNQTTYKIGIGSTAHIIDTNAEYAITSGGTWYVQETGVDVYTKSEVDNLIMENTETLYETGIEIPSGADLNDSAYTQLGHYFVGSNAIAANITNIPATYGGRLEVFATIDNESYCKHVYICNDDEGLIYTRRKLSSGWSEWVLLTPKNVCFSVGTTISATAENPFDLDTLQTMGRYTFGGTASTHLVNKPSNLPAYGGEIVVERVQLTNRYRQTIYLNSNTHTGKMWVRQAYSGTSPNLSWSSWYMFEGVQV